MSGFAAPRATAPVVRFSDYGIGRLVMSGGWGTVYSATRVRDSKKVAMKFFGYTKRSPIVAEINKEIDLMIQLQGIPGVVQLEGVFDDTADGLVPSKDPRFRYPYPVIVMEMVEGGDLFDRIASRTTVTENYLAAAFRSAMVALQGIHSRGFVHRDLKLDNMLLVSTDENSTIKIIDFGLMVQLPRGATVVRDRDVVGTEGFFAPESITEFVYSFKSDIWQAGCILYCMLCGHPAFHSEMRYRNHIVNGRFYPMTGTEWTNISESAKHLVRRMLTAVPADRISMEEILAHPWLAGSASTVDLGSGYRRRVKALALRKTMKKIFMDRDIEVEHKERRTLLADQFGATATADPESPVASAFRGIEFGTKLKNLKHVLLRNLGVDVVARPPAKRTHSATSTESDVSEDDLKILKGDIDLESYCAIMRSVDLGALATEDVFHIFDINHDGKIELKEFLLTLMSFRAPDDHDAAALYFNLFDLNEDGYIDVDELRAVVACLLQDSTAPLLPHGVAIPIPSVEELFDVIDNNPKDGRIDLEEFKQFYHTVLLPTMSKHASDYYVGDIASSK